MQYAVGGIGSRCQLAIGVKTGQRGLRPQNLLHHFDFVCHLFSHDPFAADAADAYRQPRLIGHAGTEGTGDQMRSAAGTLDQTVVIGLAQTHGLAFLDIAGKGQAVVDRINGQQGSDFLDVALAFFDDRQREFKTGTGQALGVGIADIHAVERQRRLAVHFVDHIFHRAGDLARRAIRFPAAECAAGVDQVVAVEADRNDQIVGDDIIDQLQGFDESAAITCQTTDDRHFTEHALKAQQELGAVDVETIREYQYGAQTVRGQLSGDACCGFKGILHAVHLDVRHALHGFFPQNGGDLQAVVEYALRIDFAGCGTADNLGDGIAFLENTAESGFREALDRPEHEHEVCIRQRRNGRQIL